MSKSVGNVLELLSKELYIVFAICLAWTDKCFFNAGTQEET